MSDEQRVEVVGPFGERGTVPASEVAKMGEGWRPASDAELHGEAAQAELGGPGGAALAGLTAAGRMATLGRTDTAAKGFGYLTGGEEGRKDVADAFRIAREANPNATIGGELAGLALGGIGAAGEATGAAVTSRLGEGLFGSTVGMAARGGVEGAAMGGTQAASEDAIGDHAYNGQAIFAQAAKDGLLGFGGGAVLGAGGYYLGKVGSALLPRRSGPISDATLDEVSGVEGAGRGVQAQAKAQQGLVDDLRQQGATADQAASVAQNAGTFARAKAQSGPLSGLIEHFEEGYASKVAAREGDEISRDAIKAFSEQGKEAFLKQDENLDLAARDLTRATNRIGKAEQTLDHVNFTERPEQIGKLIDGSRYGLAREAAIDGAQKVRDALTEFRSYATKGEATEGMLRGIENHLKDFDTRMSRLPVDGANPAHARDAWVNLYKLNQAVGKQAGFGKYVAEHLRTPAQQGFSDLYEGLRQTLRDPSIFGDAGSASGAWNDAFSDALPRRIEFGKRFFSFVDSEKGIVRPEGDLDKIREGLLSKLRGNAIDDETQHIITANDYTNGIRNRITAIEKYASLTPEQSKALAEGKSALDDFDRTLAASRKQAAVANRIKQQMRAENEMHGMGGVVGALTNVSTKPYATMQRIAHIKDAVSGVENGVAAGLKKFFGKSGKEVLSDLSPRAKAETVREMQQIGELAGNPKKLEDRLAQMVGDMPNYAPKTADEVKNTARRAVYALARELPQGVIRFGLLGTYKEKPRYSDQAIAQWENKRRGALGAPDGEDAPRAIVADMTRGHLNRDAIRLLEETSPQLFERTRELAWDQIKELETKGLLDKMPYQDKAAIASLLKVAPDGTWRPDFMALMHAQQTAPPPSPSPSSPQQGQLARKASRPMTDVYSTPLEHIDQGKAA